MMEELDVEKANIQVHVSGGATACESSDTCLELSREFADKLKNAAKNREPCLPDGQMSQKPELAYVQNGAAGGLTDEAAGGLTDAAAGGLTDAAAGGLTDETAGGLTDKTARRLNNEVPSETESYSSVVDIHPGVSQEMIDDLGKDLAAEVAAALISLTNKWLYHISPHPKRSYLLIRSCGLREILSCASQRGELERCLSDVASCALMSLFIRSGEFEKSKSMLVASEELWNKIHDKLRAVKLAMENLVIELDTLPGGQAIVEQFALVADQIAHLNASCFSEELTPAILVARLKLVSETDSCSSALEEIKDLLVDFLAARPNSAPQRRG